MFQELGDGVYRRRYESLDLNIGVVIGDDGVLIVDTRASHRQGDRLLRDLATLTQLPVRWVVNTHWHWDHAFGNSCFPDAEIWGHELCRKVLLERGPEMKAGAKEWLPEDYHPVIDEVEIVAPSQTFSDRASLAIGKEVVLTYHGLAHTDADIVIRVPGADVAFYGDMIEEGGPPNFGDSYPDLWPSTLRVAISEAPETFVPGHGDIVDLPFVEAQHDELVAVADLADLVVSGTEDLDDLADRGPYPPDTMRSAMRRAVALASSSG